MANTFSALDAAENPATRSSLRFSSGRGRSVSTDVVCVGLLLLAAYALLVEKNLALFVLAFLGFTFIFNPIRMGLERIG